MPDGQNLPRLEIVERAREDAQKQLLRMQEVLDSPSMKSAIEMAQKVANQVADHQRQAEEMTRLTTFSTPMVAYAPVRRDVDEDRIAQKVARKVINHFDRQKIDPTQGAISLRIKGDQISRTLPDGSEKHQRLTEKQRMLLTGLSGEYTMTKRLVELSGYKNATTVQQVLGDLKKRLCAALDLDGYPIEGEPGHGYRIAEGYRLVSER